MLDETYFVGELSIAQLNDPSVLENFEVLNKKYQRKFLRSVFGIEMARLIEEDLDKEEEDQEERFQKIINGDFFMDNDNSIEWIGLVNEEKLSPLANYVFYYIAQEGETYQAQFGESAGVSENSKRVSVDDRLVAVWNEMVEYLEPLYCYLEEYKDLYPEFRKLVKFEIINTFNL